MSIDELHWARIDLIARIEQQRLFAAEALHLASRLHTPGTATRTLRILWAMTTTLLEDIREFNACLPSPQEGSLWVAPDDYCWVLVLRRGMRSLVELTK
jgi:hypothetical protein